jgi:hypothetical protein
MPRLKDILSEEDRKKLGLNNVSFGASADGKVSIRKYETVGVFSSFSATFNLDAFTGILPVDELINELVIPLRNNFTNFAHPATIATVEEMRAIVRGINAGKSNREIEEDVNRVRTSTRALYAASLVESVPKDGD